MFVGKYDWVAFIIALCFMLGAFGQIPINDYMIGKMAKSEFRASIYGVRYIISFGVWAVVPLISFIHLNYGFDYLSYSCNLCILYFHGGLNAARTTSSDKLILSDATMSSIMKRAGIEARPHGFRSTLRTWIAETQSVSIDVAEMVLAHRPASKVVRAYERTDFLNQRREIMENWAKYLRG